MDWIDFAMLASSIATLVVLIRAFELGRPHPVVEDSSSVAHDDEEELFRRLLNHAPDAMLLVDDGGTIRELNPQVELMFGYHRSALIGRHLELLVPARHREAHIRHRTAFFKLPTARAMGAAIGKLSGVKLNGDEIPVEISLAPIPTKKGTMVLASVRSRTPPSQEGTGE
jgi:PAS domain S-box-containing protein